MRIEDRVFLVTGAASGLGAATARLLAHRGARAMLADIDASAGAAVAAELDGRTRFLRTDVTRESDGRAAVSAAIETFGRLDGLVNCAGIAPAERLLGRDGPHGLDSFRRAMEVNLVGSFNMLRLAAEAIATQPAGDGGERGVIVNTASIAAFEGQIGQCAYAASKGGVAALTLPAARELAQYGIRVVAIAPGLFATPMLSGLKPAVQDSLGASVPFPSRLGQPEEFAALVASIIENQMLNGAVLRLDGALRMGAR